MTQSIAHSRVLVTGGAGFIGSGLCLALLQQGAAVTGMDDFSTGGEANLQTFANDVRLVKGSILESELLQKAMAKIDFVFHVAAIPSVPRSMKEPITSVAVNYTGTLHLLEAARQAGVRRVVFSSSSSVYGDSTV